MECPQDLLYTADHEWIRVHDDEGTVGITEFAQDHLGDVVFVELPEVGRKLRAGEAFGVIESVKAVSDLFAPAGGEVLARNEGLLEAPELVNRAPYGDGWMIRLRLADRAELEKLLDPAAYAATLPED